MEDIDIAKVSEALSERLGEKLNLVSIEKAGSGYHAEGYKVTNKDGRQFFLKRILHNQFGFEYNERKLASMLVGHNMARRAGAKPQSLGLLLENNGHMRPMPEIHDETIIYNVQEFEPEGVSYFKLLNDRRDKEAFDATDEAELEHIVGFIATLHAKRHFSGEPERLRALYNDSLRAELIHPELTMTLLHELGDDSPLLPPSKQGEYISLLLDVIHRWKNRSDRLRALHGDFWAANLFVRKDSTVWVIDYSRIPWGDPGLDVGKWISQYVWFYHQTGNPYFRELTDRFLTLYIEKTGDAEIMHALCLGFTFLGAMYASPDVFSHVGLDVRTKMFDHIRSILKNNTFSWEV